MRFHLEDVMLYLFLVLSILFLLPLAHKNRVPGAKAALGIFLTLTIAITIPLLFTAMAMSAIPNPPKPEIRRGEFPFALTYQLGGATTTLEDTLVCKYTGWDCDLKVSGKKYRTWKSSYASGQWDLVLLEEKGADRAYGENLEPLEDGPYDVTVKLLLPYEANYYMGDTDPDYLRNYQYSSMTAQPEEPNFPRVRYEVKQEGVRVYSELVSETDLYSSDLLGAYGIQIISWEMAEPIVNTFR